MVAGVSGKISHIVSKKVPLPQSHGNGSFCQLLPVSVIIPEPGVIAEYHVIHPLGLEQKPEPRSRVKPDRGTESLRRKTSITEL